MLRADLQKGDSKKLLLDIVGIIIVAVDDVFGPISSIDPVERTSLRHVDRFVSVCFCLRDLLRG